VQHCNVSAAIGGAEGTLGGEESGGRCACRKSGEGCAAKGQYYPGWPQAPCRVNEAALGGEARGVGCEKGCAQNAGGEESGLKRKAGGMGS